MKLRIKYESRSKIFYYSFPGIDDAIKKRNREKIRNKKKIHIFLKRHLHKKITHISRILNISDWNVFCTIEDNWLSKNIIFKLKIESFDKAVNGELHVDMAGSSKIDFEVNDSNLCNLINIWNTESLDDKLTINKIKDKKVNLELNLRAMTNGVIFEKDCFSELKGKYDSIFNYLKSFNINVLYEHHIKIKEQDILWYPVYLKFKEDLGRDEDSFTKQVISFIMNSSVKIKQENPEYYSIKDISNGIILKTLFEQNILDINTFNGDDQDVTKEDIKEYFELSKVLSY